VPNTRRTTRAARAGIAVAAVAAALALAPGATAFAGQAASAADSAAAAPASGAPTPAPHVMVLFMENTDYSQMAASPEMPELNQLAHQYADFTQAYGWHYPSLPNYLELLAGSDMGIHGDCDISQPRCHNLHHELLVQQLEKAGLTWHAYYQGDARGCDQADESNPNYPYWHNSFRYFASFARQCRHISNFGPLIPDLSGRNAPDFAWVVPDLVNSGGDNGTMNSGDSFLAGELPRIMATPWYRDDGQIVIIYDTGYNDSGGNGAASGGQIPVVVISAHDRGMGTISSPVNTAGVLRSVEHAYGLPYLGNARNPDNGSLGTALTSDTGTSWPGRVSPVLRGALVTAGPAGLVVPGTLSLQGLYRFGDGRVIAVGNTPDGEGVIASGHRPVMVPGTSVLESVSCTTATTCYAVGLATSRLDRAVLVKISGGEPVSVTDLPRLYGLYGIACPTATTCYAVGYDQAGDAGAVTTITNGRASKPIEVPKDGDTPWLNAISCPTATRCYAAGLVNYVPAIVPISSGVPRKAVDVAHAWYLNGIDCPRVGNCLAVGENSTEQGIVATLTGGAAGTTTVVPGTEYLYGVGCAADGNCLLAGASSVDPQEFGTGVFVTDDGGTLGSADPVPYASGLGQVSCGASLADCISAGAVLGR
jgi:phosphatidylinositol-3-phosphatase